MAPPVTPKPATPTKGMQIIRDLLSGKSAAQREAAISGSRYAGQAASNWAAQNSGMSVNDEQRLRDAIARNRGTSSSNNGNLAEQEAAIQGARYAGRAAAEWTANNPLTRRAMPQTESPAPVGTPSVGGSSGGGGVGSSGGGGASAPPQDPLAAIASITGTIDPQLRALVPTTGELELMYKRLTDELDTNQARLKQDYSDAIKAVGSNYDQSNQYLQEAISGDQATLAKAAANLGISPEDWQSGATAQEQIETLNRLLGTSSQNEATDLAWFEKMKTLDASNFDDYSNLAAFEKQTAVENANDALLQLQQYANQLAQAQALQELIASGALGGGSSGGGGGRRGGGYRRGGGGGGGSSANPYSTLGITVDEDSVQKNAGVAELLASYSDNPEFQDYLYQTLAESGNDITRMISNIYDDRNSANAGNANSIFNRVLDQASSPFSFLRGTPFGDALENLRQPTGGARFTPEMYQDAIYQLMGYDDTLGWSTDRQISTSNAQKGRIPSVPIEQAVQQGAVPAGRRSNTRRSNPGLSLGRKSSSGTKAPSRSKPSHLNGSKFF